MALSPGARLGPYEIVCAIGAGGMGEVYRARDARLGRDVAIKALPDLFASDPERVARFQREAQILAALNDPHIASIYGLEEEQESRFLILELVEGETLADRLKAGPIPLTGALEIARQVANALQAAHEKGIIHRDLKPANVKVTRDGTVKVLDFGLAKAVDGSVPARDLSLSPTETSGGTRNGIVLGTAPYMSPEQTRGGALDKRTDIWAFGCLLYELLTGRRPFVGQTVVDTVAAILGQEPDWRALPPATAARIQWLLRRCLEKDPKRRLHDIADARIEIDEVLSHPLDSGVLPAAGPSPVIVARSKARERLPWILAGVCFVALLAALVFSRTTLLDSPPTDTHVYSSSIVLPESLSLAPVNAPGRFALSPDGLRLALVASNDASGRSMLWVRPLNTNVVQPLAGTEGASFPFWSPDSRFIAFLSQRKLKKIDVSGGQLTTLCDAPFFSTGSWNRDDVILFTPRGNSPLHRVSASGGTPSPVTTLDAASGDVQHSYPAFLPDGQHFLYFVVGSKAGGLTDPRAVYVGSLDPKEPPKQLVQGGANAKYANGHLIFLREATLFAQPFDLDRLELRGEAVPLVEQVQISGAGASGISGAFTLSQTGVLAYQTGFAVRSQLAWFDRWGKPLARLGDQADYGEVSLSPDGTRAVVSVLDPAIGTRDLWIFDVTRGLRERVTFDPSDDFAPIWSPDGNRLTFSSRRNATIHLYQRAAAGTGREELLQEDSLGKFAADWSSDGRFIVYIGGGGIISRSDLWVLPLFGERKPSAFLETTFVETHGQFSPDVRWIAYMSAHSGQQEVYVSPFPGPAAPRQVSAAGGGWPRWHSNGQEIFYLAPDNTLMAMPVNGQKSRFEVGAGRRLFQVRLRPTTRLDAFPYDVSPDGQRFLLNTFVEETTTTAITLVVNWPSGLRR